MLLASPPINIGAGLAGAHCQPAGVKRPLASCGSENVAKQPLNAFRCQPQRGGRCGSHTDRLNVLKTYQLPGKRIVHLLSREQLIAECTRFGVINSPQLPTAAL